MRTEVKYGIYFGLAVVVYVMVEHVLGLNTTRHDIGQYTRLGGVIIPIVAIFFGLREKRSKDLNGSMSFTQGLKSGFQIALIQTTLTTLFFVLYGNVINPDFLDTLIEFEKSKLVSTGAAETQIAAMESQFRSMYTLPVQPIFQLIAGLLSGTIFAAIFSFFMRDKESAASA